jgi:Family of unknown function (DUF5317)
VLIFLAVGGIAWGLRVALPPRQRARARVRWVWVPVVAALLQVGLNIGPLRELIGQDHFAVVVVSYGLVGAWLIGNAWYQAPALRLPAGLIAGGWLLNVIPIVANRGMPVSARALARIGVHHRSAGNGNLWKHVLETPHTVVPWLGDVVPVPLPLLRNVISAGDIVVLIGVVLAIQLVAFAPRPERSRDVADLVVPAASPH